MDKRELGTLSIANWVADVIGLFYLPDEGVFFAANSIKNLRNNNSRIAKRFYSDGLDIRDASSDNQHIRVEELEKPLYTSPQRPVGFPYDNENYTLIHLDDYEKNVPPIPKHRLPKKWSIRDILCWEIIRQNIVAELNGFVLSDFIPLHRNDYGFDFRKMDVDATGREIGTILPVESSPPPQILVPIVKAMRFQEFLSRTCIRPGMYWYQGQGWVTGDHGRSIVAAVVPKGFLEAIPRFSDVDNGLIQDRIEGISEFFFDKIDSGKDPFFAQQDIKNEIESFLFSRFLEGKNEPRNKPSTIKKKQKGRHVDGPDEPPSHPQGNDDLDNVRDFSAVLVRRTKEYLPQIGFSEARVLDDAEIGPATIAVLVKLAPSEEISKLQKGTQDLARLVLAGMDKVFLQWRGSAEVPAALQIQQRTTEGTIAIYFPSPWIRSVELQSFLEKLSPGIGLRLPMGIDTIGNYRFVDFDKTVNALVAGQVNSGKSVILHTWILSLLLQRKTKGVRLALVDPKGGVEFSDYEGLSNLVDDQIFVDFDDTKQMLLNAVKLMEERFTILKKEKVRKIQQLEEKRGGWENCEMERVIIIIDELGDLVEQAREEGSKPAKEFLSLLRRLAQKGRAAGIHLILATQHALAEKIPTTIKNNCGCRCTFRLPSGSASRVIIDHTGAEALTMPGDMLFWDGDIAPEPLRVQAPLVDTERITEYLSTIVE